MLLMVAFLADLAGAPEGVSTILFVTSICMFALVPFAFLLGLLRGRFSQAGAVGELVERLGTTPATARDLRRALADALGDPDLAIAYWYRAIASWTATATRSSFPVGVRGARSPTWSMTGVVSRRSSTTRSCSTSPT
jgi:hypothetical protein